MSLIAQGDVVACGVIGNNVLLFLTRRYSICNSIPTSILSLARPSIFRGPAKL